MNNTERDIAIADLQAHVNLLHYNVAVLSGKAGLGPEDVNPKPLPVFASNAVAEKKVAAPVPAPAPK